MGRIGAHKNLIDAKNDKILGKSKLSQSILRAASRFEQRSRFKNMRKENYVLIFCYQKERKKKTQNKM